MDEATARATEATANAAAEAAKLGSKALDVTSDFGGYISRTLGTIPEDALGLLGGDWLHEKRRRNLAEMKARTVEILTKTGTQEISEPSPSIVIPLLAAAADESRPELQDLWAALLATALQAGGGHRMRRAYFDTLSKMEPVDALLFRECMIVTDGGALRLSFETADEIALRLGLSGPEAEVAWNALEELQLIELRGKRAATAFGRQFWFACNPRAAA